LAALWNILPFNGTYWPELVFLLITCIPFTIGEKAGVNKLSEKDLLLRSHWSGENTQSLLGILPSINRVLMPYYIVAQYPSLLPVFVGKLMLYCSSKEHNVGVSLTLTETIHETWTQYIFFWCPATIASPVFVLNKHHLHETLHIVITVSALTLPLFWHDIAEICPRHYKSGLLVYAAFEAGRRRPGGAQTLPYIFLIQSVALTSM
jgi:hypothetical protein